MDLWEKIGNQCLTAANELLEEKTIPTNETVEMVERLIAIASSIDLLDLRWAEQNRFASGVGQGSALARRSTGNLTG